MSQRFLPPVDSNPILLVDATTGAENVYLPTQFATSRKFTIRRKDSTANLVTVRVATGQTLDGTLNGSATIPGNGEAAFVALETGQWESFIGGSGNSGSGGSYAPLSSVGYNPLNYGCVFDGTTDDTAALTAFFAARSAKDVVQFPIGRTARVTSAILISTAFTNGRLYGNNATLKLDAAASSGSIVANLAAPGLTIRDLNVDGSSVTSGTGLRPGAADQVIEDCYFLNCLTGGVYIVGSAAGLRVQGNRFRGIGWGVLTIDNCTASWIEVLDNDFDAGGLSSGDAVEINTPTGGATHVTISRNQIKGYAGQTVSGFGVGAAHASYLTITNNQIHATGNDGIHIEDASHNAVITGNIISGVLTSGQGINVLETVGGQSGDTDLTSRVQISGNNITACTGGGLAIQGSGGAKARHYRIIDNSVFDCGTTSSATYRDGILLGYQTYESICALNHVYNTRGDSSSSGINVGEGAWSVLNNYTGDVQVSKTQQYGIKASANAVATIFGNEDRGNATSHYLKVGSGTFNDLSLPPRYVLQDNFNRADASPNLGVTSDFTKTWTTSAAWSISAGKATGIPAVLAEGLTVVDCGQAAFTFQTTLVTIGDAGVAWRCTDNANGFLLIPIAGNYYQLYTLTAGSKTSVTTGGSAPAAYDIIKIVTSGNTSSIYISGQKIITNTTATYNTNTKVGFRQGGGSAGQFDDLLVY